jgi:hypothetical protein
MPGYEPLKRVEVAPPIPYDPCSPTHSALQCPRNLQNNPTLCSVHHPFLTTLSENQIHTRFLFPALFYSFIACFDAKSFESTISPDYTESRIFRHTVTQSHVDGKPFHFAAQPIPSFAAWPPSYLKSTLRQVDLSKIHHTQSVED